jgi:hypothetical protein
MRTTDETRLMGGGLVQQLIDENEQEPSTLQGDTMLTALTSFEGDLPIPLTCDIVRNAIKWINHCCELPADANLRTLVSLYLIELGNSIPKSLVFTELKKFVTDHKWEATPAEDLDKITALDSNTSDEHESALKVWKFIQVQLAWNTKIVGQVLDCQHRVIALSRVLLRQHDLPGVTQDLQQAVHSKFSNLNILVQFIIPEQELNQDVALKMKTYSALRQNSASKQVPLGPKEALSHLMSALEVKCRDQNVKFLCCDDFEFVLNKYHVTSFTQKLSLDDARKDLGAMAIFQRCLDKENYLSIEILKRPNLVPVVYVQCWIEVMSTLIKDVLVNSSVKNLVVSDPDSVIQEWDKFFQPEHTGQGNKIFKYLFGNKIYTLHHFMKHNRSIYDPQRYPGTKNSGDLEIVQLLLWFHVSEKTKTTLDTFVRASTKHFSKLISCTVHSITAAVYYSSILWEKAIISTKKKRAQFLDQQVLYFFLLISAIEQNMPFFAEEVSHPKDPPPWYWPVRARVDKGSKLQDSFLSFLTLLHVCHLNVHISEGGGGRCSQVYQKAAESLKGAQTMQHLYQTVVIVNDPAEKDIILTASIKNYLQHPVLDMGTVIKEIHKHHYNFSKAISHSEESEEEGEEEGYEGESEKEESKDEGGESESERYYFEKEKGDEEQVEEESEEESGGGEENDEEVIQQIVPSSLIESLKFLDKWLQKEKNNGLLHSLDGTSAETLIQSLRSIVPNLGDHDNHTTPIHSLSPEETMVSENNTKTGVSSVSS